MPIRRIDPAKRRITPLAATQTNTGIIARRRVRVPQTTAAAPASSAPTPSPVRAAEQAPTKRADHTTARTGANWDEDGDYIVGRGRPPRQHQWQPGQSGNPKGAKPKEKLTPQEAFDRKVMAEFNIRQNGEEVVTNLGDFALNLMKGAAAKGNLKAQQALLQLYLDLIRKQGATEETEEMETWEQELLDAFLSEQGFRAAPVIRKERETPSSEEAAS